MEQRNTPIYKHIKLLSHYSDISNNEFDIHYILQALYLKDSHILKDTEGIHVENFAPPQIFREVSATAFKFNLVLN